MCLPTTGRLCLKTPHYFHVTYHVTTGGSSPRLRTEIYYGHETPFSIKLSQVRELTRSRSRDDVANMTSGDLDTVVEECAAAGQKCEFYVKHKKTPKKHHMNDDSSYQKSMKKSKKSPNIISNLLRKIRSPHPLVFGLPLNEICDENFDPPESIIRLMVLVYRRGPTVPGILRRGNKAALAKEIREKINAGVRYSIEDHQAPTAASVFKEFLRCIPGGLLSHDLHDQWLTVSKDDPVQIKLDKIKGITSQLSPAHLRLLKLTVSLLQHLAKHSSQTNMGPSNLATCIAPSFCSPTSGAPPVPGFPHGKGSNSGFPSPGSGGGASSASALMQVQNSVREITTVFTPLITFMIVKHVELFGPDILTMFMKYDCEASPPISLEEMGEEGREENNEEGTGGDGDKMASMIDGAGGRHRDSSMGDEVEEEDDEYEMGVDDDDDGDGDEEDEEEEEEYGGNYGRHQAKLRCHPHSQHADQHPAQRHGTQAPSGPRDSNSGTDSDSMHSVLSMPDTGSGMGYRRDDSSLDSLVEREYFQHEEAGSGSPQAHKSHLSPSNLSRDSGLTLSDTQLYEEEGGTGVAGCPYPGEAMAGRLYQRSTSSNFEMDPHQPPESDDWLGRSMVDSRALENRRGDRLNREGKKKFRDSSEGSDGESGQGPATFRTRPPFKHSTSSPLLDIQPRNGGNAGGAELKPCLTHPPVGKRVSSDSIGEEDEGQFDHEAYLPRHNYHQHHAGQPGSAIDFRRLRLNKDMGTIVKSNSGTHLFLSNDTLPTRYNLTRGQGKVSSIAQTTQQPGRILLRQGSVTDSLGSPTPPTSPDVKTLDSYEEPTISHLAKNNPLFPPESTNAGNQTKAAPWQPEMNSAYRDWDGQLANKFSLGSLSLAFSKSTSDLRAQDYANDETDDVEEQDKTITADNISKISSRPESPAQPASQKMPPPSPKLWGGRKSHEAEEVVDMRKRPHFSLMLRPESDYTPLSQPYRKQSLGLPPQHLIKGSPPPNVILQSLSGSRKEVSQTSVPLRASYDSVILSQVRRSSATDSASHDIVKSINSIRPEEYVSVTSKPIMITSTTGGVSGDDSGSNSTLRPSSLCSSSSSSSSSLASPRPSLSPLSSASARRAKLAKYMESQSDITLSSKDQVAEGIQQRPDKPPNYHQALQRNFMIKHSVPIDITDDDTGKQRELNAKAKALYEKSLQLYNEQRVNRTKEEDPSGSPLKNNKLVSNSLKEDSVIDQGNNVNDKLVHSSRTSNALGGRSVPQNTKTSPNYLLESPPSPSESGFLDLGSISHSLQTDVLSRREKHQARASLAAPATSTLSTFPASSEESSVSASLSRHDSRLSDVSGSSSGGSTITISTLGRPSDTSSGSRASMASSVASSTGGDSSSEPSLKQHPARMSYSRHFRPQDGGEEDGKAKFKEEEKERGRKELEWTSEGEGVYVSLKKNPQQLYLESKKMYEQKQTPAPSHLSSQPQPSSSSLSSTESKTVQSQIAHFHSQFPQPPSKSSPSLNPFTTHKNSREHPRPKSIHDVYSLQRSQSDASNSAVRAVRHSPQLKDTIEPQPSQTKVQDPERVNTQVSSLSPRVEIRKPEQDSSPSTSAHSGPSDMPSEHHQNFLKARSLFHPEVNNSHHVGKPSYKEHARVSTSSSSSAGSELSTEPGFRKSSLPQGSFHRLGGPQAFADGFGSYSSSEDGYSSSLDRKSRRSLDSSEEALSDHTNITYV
ncbi:hypothetical protein RRG08_006369 [Elysia crispata]|uniref:Rho-GAP domain-containing protein n=1 Tax=Elysia crispata TaxID=231223 RepID=A0AAE0Z9G0_9GAST|nr:hypothetical protein RRG08_006369 [Elysia crispata]